MNLTQRNVVLSVLAAALAVPTVLQLRADAETFVDVSRVPLLFDGFTADNVGQVLLAKPKEAPAETPRAEGEKPDAPRIVHDQLAMRRGDDGWEIAALPGQAPTDLVGAPIDAARLENDLWKHLRSIRADRETLVQANATPEQLAAYGLDDAQAFVVKVADLAGQNIVAELRIGRDAGQGVTGTEAVRGAFVRKADSTDVVLYEWQTPLPRSVEAEPWLDRVLARIEPDQVRRLSIKNSAHPRAFVFERPQGQGSWVAVDPPVGVGAVRQSEVDALVQRLRYLPVQRFRLPLVRAGNMAALGLFPPQIELRVTAAEADGERSYEFDVGSRLDDANEFYVRSSESDFLITWPVGTVTPFELDVPQRLFDPAPPAGAQPPPEPAAGDAPRKNG